MPGGRERRDEDRDARLAEVLDELAEQAGPERDVAVEPADEPRAVDEEEEQRDEHHHRLEHGASPSRAMTRRDRPRRLPPLLAGDLLDLLLRLGDRADELARGVLEGARAAAARAPDPLARRAARGTTGCPRAPRARGWCRARRRAARPRAARRCVRIAAASCGGPRACARATPSSSGAPRRAPRRGRRRPRTAETSEVVSASADDERAR